MRILYFSSHSILEYDEVRLFTQMGHEVISLGAYTMNAQGDGTRPPIEGLYDNPHLRNVAIQCSKENVHQELIDWADVIFQMHNARTSVDDPAQPWLSGNWDKFKDKKVVWRSIGQSSQQIEEAIKPFRNKGLKIVRYSPKEQYIPGFAGEDAVIRFYKDPDEYFGYNGQIPRVVNLSQALFGGSTVRSRGDHMSMDFFNNVVDGLDWKVFGPDNENAGEHNGGSLGFEDLKQMFKFNRVFFYVGTRPASYTLGLIEAMMTGMPVVTIGPEHGNEIYQQKTFEGHEVIGEGGRWSDSVTQCHNYLAQILENKDLAMDLGAKARARAIELFGKGVIMKQWEDFLKKL